MQRKLTEHKRHNFHRLSNVLNGEMCFKLTTPQTIQATQNLVSIRIPTGIYCFQSASGIQLKVVVENSGTPQTQEWWVTGNIGGSAQFKIIYIII